MPNGRRFSDRVSRPPAQSLAWLEALNLNAVTEKPMHPLAPHTAEITRQFLMAMCAQAHSKLALQHLGSMPQLAIQAQANLNRQAALELLRD